MPKHDALGVDGAASGTPEAARGRARRRRAPERGRSAAGRASARRRAASGRPHRAHVELDPGGESRKRATRPAASSGSGRGPSGRGAAGRRRRRGRRAPGRFLRARSRSDHPPGASARAATISPCRAGSESGSVVPKRAIPVTLPSALGTSTFSSLARNGRLDEYPIKPCVRPTEGKSGGWNHSRLREETHDHELQARPQARGRHRRRHRNLFRNARPERTGGPARRLIRRTARRRTSRACSCPGPTSASTSSAPTAASSPAPRAGASPVRRPSSPRKRHRTTCTAPTTRSRSRFRAAAPR